MLYKVFFEIYGKKLQVEVEADNDYHAKRAVENDIVFHKVVPSKCSSDHRDKIADDATVNYLKDMFGIKG